MPTPNPYIYPTSPSQSDFDSWVQYVMGVPTTVIGPGSGWLVNAYNQAFATVNPIMAQAGLGILYTQAVYFLGGDILVNDAPDDQEVLYPTNNPDNLFYWAYLRKQWNILGTGPTGAVQSTGDESTNASYTVPKVYEALTPDQVQNLKTPWGRRYLGIAAQVGTNWGIT